MDSMKTFWAQCGLCEDEAHLFFECKDCQQLICERCKLIHGKVSTLACHTVVDLRKNFVQENFQKVNFSCIPCQNHMEKKCVMFCIQCDVPICPECVTTVHVKHAQEQLAIAGSNKIEGLIWFNAYAKFYSLRLKQDTEGLKKKRDLWKEQISAANKMVDENEQDLLQAVKKYADEIRSTIDQKRQAREDLISNKEKDNSSKEVALRAFGNLVDKTLETDEGEIIFHTATEQRKLENSLSCFSVPTEVITISPPDLSTYMLANVFGPVKHFSISSKVKLELVTSATLTDCNGIDKMVMCSDGSAWLSVAGPDNKRSHLRRENFSSFSSMFSRAKIVELDAFDLALATELDDTLFVSVHMTSEVHRIDKRGENELFVDVSPLIVRGIHVTKQNEVFVGVRDKVDLGKRYELTEKSRRQVLVFDIRGQQKDVFEYDKNGQRLFTIPTRICTGINDDMVVNDAISENRCVIKSVGRRTRGIKWKFSGRAVSGESNQFRPDDIVRSPSGFIVTVESTSNRIYVLSADGELIAFKDVRKWKMVLPMTLSFDSKGLLRIGCGTHMIRREDIKKFGALPIFISVKISAL